MATIVDVRLPFADRTEAGQLLGETLAGLGLEDPLVTGLPRGGVPVAAEVARALRAPLDVIIVRKLGTPGHAELAMGALGEGGVMVRNDRVMSIARPGEAEVDRVVEHERAEIRERARRFRAGRAAQPLEGRTVVIVDDGLATGSTAEAAVRVARAQGAGRVVLAVPVGAADSVERLSDEADEVVCLAVPEPFGAVGAFYRDFGQTREDEVVRLLDEAAERSATSAVPTRGSGSGPVRREIEIDIGPGRLPGSLDVPAGASGVVLFAHGSGSSRHSSRNRYVAERLRARGLGTLLFDLLLPVEAEDRRNVFDIGLLADRLLAAADHVRSAPDTAHRSLGFFGASTGGGAALVAAARRPDLAGAVVSRGGRPDLAGEHLGRVEAPVLLIVGGADVQVLELNRQAAAQLRRDHRVEIVPGATHLFEEPGALEQVADLTADWFRSHLVDGPGGSAGEAPTPR